MLIKNLGFLLFIIGMVFFGVLYTREIIKPSIEAKLAQGRERKVLAYKKKLRSFSEFRREPSLENAYIDVFSSGGEGLLVALVFCDLVAGYCVDVREDDIAEKPQYYYRIKEDIDITLLSEVEKIVSKNMVTFISLPEIIARASHNFFSLGKDEVARSILARISGNAQGRTLDMEMDYRSILKDALKIISAPYRYGGCI